jgi:probable HAF family extracellular repeat protein
MKPSSWMSLLGAALATISLAAQAANPTYRLTQISPGDPSTGSLPRYFVGDLNDKGEVVGSRYVNSSTSTPNAFLWQNGTITDLGNLGDASGYAEALGINNRTEIVGTSLSPNGFRGFYWKDGQISDLGSFPDATAQFAWGINLARQILGEKYDDTTPDGVPFVQRGTQTRVLNGLPAGSPYRHASDINELGVVAGDAWTATEEPRAVIWITRNPIELGGLPGASRSHATGLNDWVQVVGNSEVGSVSRAWRWEFGATTELAGINTGPSWSTHAHENNNRGQIVGYEYNTSSAEFIPVLWNENRPVDLNTLVDSADPLKPYVTLSQARVINNKGQIVATGRDVRAPNNGPLIPYLLTPIGE